MQLYVYIHTKIYKYTQTQINIQGYIDKEKCRYRHVERKIHTITHTCSK